MNAPLDMRFDKPSFLQWVQAQEGRYELAGGWVVLQQSGTQNHARISARFVRLLASQLDEAIWTVLLGEFAVEIDGDIRIPDVLAFPTLEDGKALSTAAPVVVIEVLSPSSLLTDLDQKPPRYMSLPSLEAYILASQDEMGCWVWRRSDDTRAFPGDPETHVGAAAAIVLPALGVRLPLADVYRGIVEA